MRCGERSARLVAVLMLAGCSIEGADKGKPAVDSSVTSVRTTTIDSTTRPPKAASAPAKPDSQMQAVLDQLTALGGKPIALLDPSEARQQPTPSDAVKALLTKEARSTTPDVGVTTSDRTIPGPGGPLPVRVYTPQEGSAPYPVVVYYHGGGWVIANKDVYDAGARALAKLANAVVLSVDYRQGPEHKFPAAHDDAFAAYKWVLSNAASIKGEQSRVAVAGESAGGGLALATAIQARNDGVPLPAAIIAIYPIAGTDTMTPSYVENAQAVPLNRAMMTWFFNNYLRSPADRQDARVNLVAADLHGLPPTTIINAQIDPLRSEGEKLADKMRAAGDQVDQRTFPGVTHEFFGMGAVVDQATAAEQMAANALKKAFGR